MNKKILIVNWGTKDKQYVFQTAKKKGLEIFLATNTNYPSWIKKYISKDNLILTNTYDSECLIIDTISHLHQHNIELDGVTTFFEMNLSQTADLAAALHLPFISPIAAKRSSNNKLLMRYHCHLHHISQPKFSAFNNLEQGLRRLKQFKSPIIIKPVKSGHSYGVFLVKGNTRTKFIDDFKKKYTQARQHLDANYDEWMLSWPYKGYFLIEEYIEGKVVSVDGLIQNNKIVFIGTADFELSTPPLMLEQQTYIPSRLSPTQSRQCIRLTKKIINILGFDNCGFHCELKLTSSGPLLIEIAARPPGGQMIAGYQKAFNIDLASQYFNICLGEKIITQSKAKPIAFILQESIPHQKKGIVSSINGLDVLNNHQVDIFSMCKIGSNTFLNSDMPAPAIYYQISATTQKKLIEIQQAIHHKLEFTVKPEHPLSSYFRKNILTKIKSFF